MNERRFLDKLRQLQGNMPLESFARKLEIDPSHLSRLYRGERSPGLQVIQGALRAFPQVSLKEWGLRAPDDVRKKRMNHREHR